MPPLVFTAQSELSQLWISASDKLLHKSDSHPTEIIPEGDDDTANTFVDRMCDFVACNNFDKLSKCTGCKSVVDVLFWRVYGAYEDTQDGYVLCESPF